MNLSNEKSKKDSFVRIEIHTFIVVFMLSLYGSTHLRAQEYRFERKCSWQERFNKRGRVDSNNWNYHIGKFSNEEEFYTDSIGNVFVRNGKLHIVATKDIREDKVCSSGRINTLGKQSFLYGKLDIRAKVPMGKGIFPAIWMLRGDHARVYPLGEIDIMEYIECFEGKEYSITTHIVEKQHGLESIRHKHSRNVNADMTRFHIYSLEWTPTYLRFLLDSMEVFRLTKEDAEYWPFDVPYYLILNVAYGNWGAQCGMDDTIFPREMLVDWIRYYPLKNDLSNL